MPSIRNQIRELRAARSMTQQELADQHRRHPPDRHRHRTGQVLALA